MVKSTHVTFEQAKHLKEIGYEVSGFSWYHRETKKLHHNDLRCSMNKLTENFSAPEQWEVVEWLRSERNIFISVLCDIGTDLIYTYKIYSTKIGEEGCLANGGNYETPQLAYREALDSLFKMK